MSGDCELPQYYKCKERKARKSHVCCECMAPIVPGEKYLQVNGCWDYVPQVFRQHLLCAQACEFVRDATLVENCLSFGELKEWYRDWVKGCFDASDTVEKRRKIWGFIINIKRRERRAVGFEWKNP